MGKIFAGGGEKIAKYYHDFGQELQKTTTIQNFLTKRPLVI
jgi:hypothetical protein